MSRVFVYGTLKRGQRNAHYLQLADYLGEFTTTAAYRMYLFEDYPAVCLPGGRVIAGEVYELNDAQLRALDQLEGYPDFYQRIEIDTSYGICWMYIVSAERCLGKPELTGIWPAGSGR